MVRAKGLAYSAATIVSVCILILASYAIGKSQAPSRADARAASHDGYRSAYRSSKKKAHATSMTGGVAKGKEEGLVAGAKKGTEDGLAELQRRQLFEAAVAQQKEADRKAELDRQRARNCGAPLFGEDACPTDAELQLENEIEGLCGGGIPEKIARAKELGIQC